ncbi:plasmid transfer protein TraA [Streptomyces chartreusis]|uniref:plasmid transfer protein TraA n=1 Tax=Streptomyces chartreusis TaxID=1969 RepID=UPI0033C03805
MADVGSANRANNRRYREQQRAGSPLIDVSTGARYQASTPRQRQQARRQKTTTNKTRNRTTNRTRNIYVTVNKPGTDGGGAQGQWTRQSPIGDAEFLSAGHVRAFSERGRKAMRQAAMDFSYAAEALKAVLREVPPPQGEGRGQMYMKANRVARSYKRAATACQAASAHSARTWPAFMREYEPWLNQFGGPKPQPRRNMNFGA